MSSAAARAFQCFSQPPYTHRMRPRSTPELEPLDHLGDFTATARLIPIAGLAVAIGLCAALVATGLLKLIGLFANLFFFQRVATELVSPAGHHLGPFVILVPVAGALVIGLMARYGSDRI